MNLIQLLTITAIRVVIALLCFPLIPFFLSDYTLSQNLDVNTVDVYRVIFSGGVITMLIFETIFVGTKAKNEKLFILFSISFLAIIFYQNYTTLLYFTISYLILSLFILLLRMPFRILITKYNILSS